MIYYEFQELFLLINEIEKFMMRVREIFNHAQQINHGITYFWYIMDIS